MSERAKLRAILALPGCNTAWNAKLSQNLAFATDLNGRKCETVSDLGVAGLQRGSECEAVADLAFPSVSQACGTSQGVSERS